jgi:Spy/CpxP family protein refolding chaperone
MRGAALVAFGVLSVAVAGVTALAAQKAAESHDGGRGFRRGGFMAGRMARALDLTDDQKASVKALMEEQRKAAEPLWQQHRELRQQIRQQLDSGNPDPATVGRLTIQASGVGKQLREARAQAKERLSALLTAEQKTRLDALQKARGWRGHRGFGHRGGSEPGSEPEDGGPDEPSL